MPHSFFCCRHEIETISAKVLKININHPFYKINMKIKHKKTALTGVFPQISGDWLCGNRTSTSGEWKMTVSPLDNSTL